MKQSTILAVIDWLRQNDTDALVDRIFCGTYSKCGCCGFDKYIGHGSSCNDAWKAMGSYIENTALESGTCELEEVDSYTDPFEGVHILECSACGHTCEHINGSYPRCPHCGRKTVRQ